MKRLAAILCLLSAPAFAQSNPSFITGQIPTAAQWNSYFGKKADVTGGTINNGVLNSVTINGSLGGSPSVGGVWTSNGASLNGFTVSGGTINNTPIGGTTPAAVSGTTGSFTGSVTAGTTGGTAGLQDGSSHTGGYVLTFTTEGTLRTFQPTFVGTVNVTAITSGYTTQNDGGSATYTWSSTSACTFDSFTCITPSGTWPTGRWLLQVPPGGVDVRAAGAKCDGATDDSTALNNASTRLSAFGGGTLIIPATGCVVNSATFNVKSGIVLKGVASPFVTVAGFSKAYQASLFLNPSFTVAALSDSQIRDLTIYRFGLATTPANMEAVIAAVNTWNGEVSAGITMHSNNVVDNVRIIGFNTCISQAGQGSNRISRVQFDCANGIDVNDSNDTILATDITANGFWSPGFGSRYGLNSATTTAGANYLVNDLVTATGGTCITQPVLKVLTINGGGQPTSYSVNDTGDCTVLPGGTTFTGGAGTGLHATLNFQDGSYRPGIAYNWHDGPNGDMLTNFQAEHFQTCVHLSNAGNMKVINGICEAGLNMAWAQITGVFTENCTTSSFVNVQANANYINYKLNAASDNSGATCTTGTNIGKLGITYVTGGNTAGNSAAMYANVVTGTNSAGVIAGMQIASCGISTHNIIVGATSKWTLANLQFNPNSACAAYLDRSAVPTTLIALGGIADNSGALSAVGYQDLISGAINLSALPTSCAGLVAGTAWNNTNVVNICP